MSKNRNFSRNGSNNKHRNGKKPSRQQANPQQTLQKAKQAKEKYLSLAREALASGDRVEAESFFQHADHYTRVINSVTPERQHYERPAQEYNAQQQDNQQRVEVVSDSGCMGDGESNADGAVIEYQNDMVQAPQELAPIDA